MRLKIYSTKSKLLNKKGLEIRIKTWFLFYTLYYKKNEKCF